MWTRSPLDAAASMEILIFEVPEVSASERMTTTATECSAALGIRLTRIDVWADPGAVLAHGILSGPTLLLLADGTEVDRLLGPCSHRRICRFLARLTPAPAPISAAA